jgi:hypothetical protein
MYLGAFEGRNEFALGNLSVSIGVDQLENVVSLGLGELDVKLLEYQLQQVVCLLAIEESASVLVKGRPNIVDHLSNI